MKKIINIIYFAILLLSAYSCTVYAISLTTFFLIFGIATFMMGILIIIISAKHLIKQERNFYIMYDKIKDKTVEEIMKDKSLTDGFNTGELEIWRKLIKDREENK